MYAEMLQKKGLPEEALKTYANASKNSLEANKVLEAITFKILQWRIDGNAMVKTQAAAGLPL